MNPGSDFSLSALRRKRGELAAVSSIAISPSEVVGLGPPLENSLPPAENPASSKPGFSLPFDPLRIIDALYRRAWLMLLAGLVVAGLVGYVGRKHFQTHHTAVAQIIKQAPAAAFRQSESGDPYQPHELAIPTLTALMRSAALMEKTSQRLGGKFSESLLKSGLVITPERNTDIIRVAMNSDEDAETAVAMLKAYVEEVLFLTRDIQQHDASEMNRFLTSQTASVDEELIKVSEQLLAYGKREQLVDADKQMEACLGEMASFSMKYETTRLEHETLDLKIGGIESELSKVSPTAGKLQQAREELAQLQLRYTDEHPSVMEAAGRVKAMEAAAAGDKPRLLDAPPKAGESSVAESMYLDLVKLRSEKQVLGQQLEKLLDVRAGLNTKLEQLPRKALEYARIKSRKQALETSRMLLVARQREASMQEENAQGSFRLLAMARLQDVVIEKPTKKLMMLCAGGFAATAGLIGLVFSLLTVADRRVLTVADLKRGTGLPVLGSLGILNEGDPADWAFRTWTKLQPRLLMPATGGATVCGLLTSDAPDSARMPMLLAEAAASRGLSVILVADGGPASTLMPLREAVEDTDAVLRQIGNAPEQVVHLTLDPEWRWTHEQRQQWLRALGVWSQARGSIVLVQLTAPERAETLLVAERLPNLLWIGRSEQALVDETQSKLSTYRAAGCRLVGALLDQAPKFRFGPLNKLAAATACLLLCGAGMAQAESVVLGPGDAVNISAAGYPEYARSGVGVGADGKLTYLQAQDIQAAGLTIDQLREQLNTELRRYYKNMIIVVTPETFQSRKVYVLGKVVKKGAVNIDRPLTVLEVVAEAGGLETGLFQQNTVELADLGRSFLVRDSARMPINLEALFLHGDMTQNILVQAGDYLYFPSANSNEIYVLGNVKMQGTQGLLAHTSVHSAIAQAGGFSPKAYTRRVLVVRGSLEKPESFVVNMDDLLAARAKGFRLQPKDIVYIADKPWARAEELLGFAVNAFLQGAVSGWTTANVGPFIKEAFLPSLK